MPCWKTYSSSAVCSHAHSLTTRTRVAQGQQGSSRLLWCVKTTCHPGVMSHPLQHLTLTTSTSSLSPTSPIFQSFSPSQSHSLVLDPKRSGGSTESPSPTFQFIHTFHLSLPSRGDTESTDSRTVWSTGHTKSARRSRAQHHC